MRLFFGLVVWFVKTLTGKQAAQASEQIEVERKYRLSENEFEALPGLLESSGFRYFRTQEMTDTFIPAQESSEMIRIRDLSDEDGNRSVLTLKKWITVDGESVRQERETESLDPVARDCLLEMGSRLAKDALLTFSKERVEYRKRKDRKTVTVALDRVEGLGAFSGPYVEVEVLAKRKEDVKQALDCVDEIAGMLLGDGKELAPSYREMLKQSLLNS